ncbi:UV-endonuclease UvdE [Dendrothele bispora CBS 962.96]|uniref:UV-endonuclease UvdE n=1 Tax=Dendrothele bispora (strain CBS 962.96) TaxID=1314807 RepID=A0A4V4HBR9_DENBC|nr:UV-endonuclease UvdE [Dendrothele bispora CBS 962.96]
MSPLSDVDEEFSLGKKKRKTTKTKTRTKTKAEKTKVTATTKISKRSRIKDAVPDQDHVVDVAGQDVVNEDVKPQADEESSSPSKTKTKKPRKPRAPKPEPVYIIPDVERKETKFRGRLGYACLNTVLRNKKPASDAVFCSRTCRIDSIKKNGIESVKELGRKNVQDLITMIQWNEENSIRFLRVSSNMFPFASHPIYGYSLSYASDLLSQAGALAAKYGHRLTSHPGQFTQLGSPRPGVIEASIRELKYHTEMMELMGVGKDGVLVIHGGGVYDDKEKTLERLKETIRDKLPRNVRERLVLENDEMCYSAEDLLPICEELDVPLIFDYHHDSLKPSSFPPREIIRRTNAIFKRRGIRPKQHLSEPRPGAESLMERRAHADRCSSGLPTELEEEGVGMDVDLMIEAKDKEQAVFELYRMYGLVPCGEENLRPPNPNQKKETNGRKSNKKKQNEDGKVKAKSPRKKGKAKKIVDMDVESDEDESIDLGEDVEEDADSDEGDGEDGGSEPKQE